MNAPVAIRAEDVESAQSFDAADFDAHDEGPRVGKSMRLAFLALALFVGIFVLWAWSAPLNSAAIASGMLEADGGGRRTVQHLEGGIIKRFLVTEGQKVKAGQTLVLLDATQSNARDSATRTSFYTLLAQNARLEAERLGLRRVVYPAELLSVAGDEEIRSIIAASDSVFATRQRGLSEQGAILGQRLGQTRADMGSTNAQLSAIGNQSKLLADEERAVRSLVEEGLERKSRLLSLQRQIEANEGQRGQLSGNLARLGDTIGETRAQITFLRGQMASDAASQQREVQMQIAEAREKLRVSGDIRNRQHIIAPISGTISNLRLVTTGGVIGPGQPLLDIVPSDEKVIVTARLKANDIEAVRAGLKAEVKLTPYKARVVPMLRGVVRQVSPDASYDEAANLLYYKVTIELDKHMLAELKHVKLISGMPAEVFIDLGSRSLVQYFVQPLLDSFDRAFRED